MPDQIDSKLPEDCPSNPIVFRKYTTAGEIASSVLKKVIAKCVAGESVKAICEFGDKTLVELTCKVFSKNKKIKRGIAFPTCVSLNNCLCNASFLVSSDDVILKDGDSVKIDLGAHIDGFVGCAAHTLIVGATEENPTTGVYADLLYVGNIASQAVLRLLHKSTKMSEIAAIFHELVNSFGFKAVDEFAAYRVSKYELEDEKKIFFHESEINKKSNLLHEIDDYEVYCISFFLTNTAMCKPRDLGSKTTVYRMTKEIYSLKLKSSRELIRHVAATFQNMPFSIRNLENEAKAKLGIKECLEHGVLMPYNVVYLKEDDLCVHFKFTVIVQPNGVVRTTQDLWNDKLVTTDKKVTDLKMLDLLEQPLKKKANK